MSGIGTYGFINAKVRAMRSTLLTAGVYQNLVNAQSVPDLIQMLAQTHYKSIIDEISSENDESLELLILKEEIRQLAIIHKNCKGPLQVLLTRLLERFEGDQLKKVLRCWHKKQECNTDIFKTIQIHDIPYDSIQQADSFEDILVFLIGSPFHKTLNLAASQYEPDKTTFPLELAIDRQLFTAVWEAADALSKKDRQMAQRLLGIEIDLRNIDWIGRLRNYYKLSPTDIRQFTLANGYRLNADGLQRLATEGSVKEAVDKVIQGGAAKDILESKIDIPLQDLEKLLYYALLLEARKAFSQFPFTIGSIMGFFFLIHIEAKNVRTLVQGKRYGLSAERLQSLLIL